MVPLTQHLLFLLVTVHHFSAGSLNTQTSILLSSAPSAVFLETYGIPLLSCLYHGSLFTLLLKSEFFPDLPALATIHHFTHAPSTRNTQNDLKPHVALSFLQTLLPLIHASSYSTNSTTFYYMPGIYGQFAEVREVSKL